MLRKTVVFDKTASYWSPYREYNYAFLRGKESYINDIIRHRGYIYLNQIYEMLGVGWNPEEENYCIKNDNFKRKVFVSFDVCFLSDGSVHVNIMEGVTED